MKNLFEKFWLALAIFCVAWIFPAQAHAGMMELSLGLSFSSNDYGNGSYEWMRKWGASIGYHITELSEIELAFQDVTDKTNIVGYENTTFHDQIYSLDWVQSLTDRNAPVQPYFKLGIGELNREATGSYIIGAPPQELDQLTAIVGAGLRFYLTKAFALRGEGTTYLIGGNIGTWSQNFAVSFGVSVFF